MGLESDLQQIENILADREQWRQRAESAEQERDTLQSQAINLNAVCKMHRQRAEDAESKLAAVLAECEAIRNDRSASDQYYQCATRIHSAIESSEQTQEGKE